MTEILHDLSPSALVKAIEDNLFALIPAFSKWPQAEVYDGNEIKWSITNIPFAMFNSVFRARLAPHQVDSVIQSVISRAKARNVPVLWWTGPQTQPGDLEERLQANGFAHMDHEPGMAADLAGLEEDWSVPPGLTIQPVRDAEGLKQWCRVCVEGFEMPSFVEEAYFDFMWTIGFSDSLPYLGSLDGQPVAVSLAVLAAGVVGLYNVTTLPAARRKGIGIWMTLAPLLEARLRGYRVGILQASEMGVGVYHRLGFKEYCQIGHYLWSPAPASEAAV